MVIRRKCLRQKKHSIRLPRGVAFSIDGALDEPPRAFGMFAQQQAL
ncbi:hypothetical protein X743_33460 [Mesorhizobium sp. LNHC252B00]|nr:hypothetical protein X743_33460 [Mesorhizobium sp. LNHC252B00]